MRRKTAANLFFASGRSCGLEDGEPQRLAGAGSVPPSRAKQPAAFISLPFAPDYLKAKSMEEDSLLDLAFQQQALELRKRTEDSYQGERVKSLWV